VGYNAASGDFHDAGIVWHPAGAYILCVMSTGSTREEADRTVASLSRAVYGFLAAGGRLPDGGVSPREERSLSRSRGAAEGKLRRAPSVNVPLAQEDE
jgi:hypothetical protein